MKQNLKSQLSWVTKTDVVSYLRCPYAFYQLYKGAIQPQDAIDALGVQLIREGIDFEDRVAASAEPLPPEVTFEQVRESRLRVYRVPVFANEELRLRGAPDAIDAAEGALLPIEVKSHKDLRRTDELELAFYWLVLEPHRTRQVAVPRGQVILRRDGNPFAVDVELIPERFEEVRDLVSDIRRARRYGVEPRVCGCTACRGPLREQITLTTRARKDLTMIFGVAHQRARMLEQMGIADYDALQQAPAEDIVAYFRAAKRPVSLAEVARWKEHAESYRRGEVNIFQPFPHLGDHFVVLDLEYEPVAADVWLIGACHVTPQRQEYVSFWSSSPRQCRSALRALEEFRYLTKACPIVTWNGLGADLPILERACNRLGLDQLGHLMRYRHVDLYDWAAKSMRLPIPSLSLKEVSSYFGIPRTTDIQDGLQAQMLYEQYRRLKPSAEREAVKRRLVHYNREDIEVLVEFIRKLEHVRVRAAAPTLQPPPI